MSNIGFNINSFIKGSPDEKEHVITNELVQVKEPKKTVAKRATKKKNEEQTTPPQVIQAPETSMSYIQQNIPYATAYQETNRQLDESIAQLNALGGEIVMELQSVRGSKTLRNKYNIINDMTATATSIITAKITAIKEKNKTINDINHAELARLKELKTQANEEDDNARIANLYDAFINTPVGASRAVLAPPINDIIINGGLPEINRMSIGSDQAVWEQNLDPAQNRMVLEARGSIETVVMYDESSGNRWFEVVDKNTRQPVPNVDKPDSSYIYDLDINVRGGFAKDSNRNVIYPLIVVNSENNSMEGY